MRFSASRRVMAIRPALILMALLCAGCNLGAAGNGARSTFEGAPVIHIAAPSPNQIFLAGATVIVQARVENAGPDLARISVLLDDALLGEKRNPNATNAAVLPLTIDWQTGIAGDYKISVIAERGDGSLGREDVQIAVVTKAGEPSGEASAPEVKTPAPDAGSDGAMTGTMLQPARIRAGPGAAYELLGSLDENEDVRIVAVNPSGDWYRIRADDLDEAWIYAEFARATADSARLPVETGPPPPVAEGVNLVVLDVQIEPPVVCGEEATLRTRIRNAGAAASQSVAWVVAAPQLTSDGRSLSDDPPLAYLKTLEAGEEETIDFPITLTARVGEEQVIRVVADSGNHLAETDETDNSRASRAFILQPGACG